jgi:hypothetical protein
MLQSLVVTVLSGGKFTPYVLFFPPSTATFSSSVLFSHVFLLLYISNTKCSVFVHRVCLEETCEEDT